MAQDPYRYFRIEASELSEQLAVGVLALKTPPFEGEHITRLLRAAHTLKGAARVVKLPAIAQLSHELEELLEQCRERHRPTDDAELRALLGKTDAIRDHLRNIDAPVANQAPLRPKEASEAREAPRDEAPAMDETFRSIRVETADLEVLLRGVTELTVRLGALHKDLRRFDDLEATRSVLINALESRQFEGPLNQGTAKIRATLDGLFGELSALRRSLFEGVSRVEGELSDVRGAAQELRLTPAQALFPTLSRAVHDAADTLGRKVVLETAGGDIRLDAHVLSVVREALLHVVRNAVAHGVETPADRERAGKPSLATVHLAVERRGNRVLFRCSDDGRGIDVDAVRRALVSRGQLPAQEAAQLDEAAVLQNLLRPGFSTSAAVNEIAGRGIGLDVVRASMQNLKGEVQLSTRRGHGTTISLEVPISVASIPVLLVEADSVVSALPLSGVKSTQRVPSTEIRPSRGRELWLHEGELLPFLPLERALSPEAVATYSADTRSLVLIRSAERSAAIGVTRILGTAHLVVRSLPAAVKAEPVVAGAALDAEGQPLLVLDPAALVAAAETRQSAASDTPLVTRLPILVIDDSLTTRMLEQSILQSAGYEVELAVSAEEGLALARRKRYGLFVVDVEMPGMTGFDFVAMTRDDPELRKTPAILVTSRDAPEDKRRGQQVGARGYIVKGEFEQGHYMHLISSLMDEA